MHTRAHTYTSPTSLSTSRNSAHLHAHKSGPLCFLSAPVPTKSQGIVSLHLSWFLPLHAQFQTFKDLIYCKGPLTALASWPPSSHPHPATKLKMPFKKWRAILPPPGSPLQLSDTGDHPTEGSDHQVPNDGGKSWAFGFQRVRLCWLRSQLSHEQAGGPALCRPRTASLSLSSRKYKTVIKLNALDS